MFTTFRTYLGGLIGTPLPAPPHGSRPRPRVQARPPRPQLAAVHSLMRASDTVTVIGLARTAGYIAAPSPLASPQLDQRVREIPARMARLGQKGQTGATNFATGLREARQVMRKQPHGRLKRVILVSDGEDNTETGAVMPIVHELAAMKVRIDCVAFGPWSSTRRLEEIAGATRGRVLRARGLRDLKAALQAASERIPPRQAGGRLAAIAVLMDVSASMFEPMPEEGGRRRIEVAVRALLDWLAYQRLTYA